MSVTIQNDGIKTQPSAPLLTPLSAFIREQATQVSAASESFGPFAASALVRLAEDVESLEAKSPAEFDARSAVMPDVLRDALWTLETIQDDVNRALRRDDLTCLGTTLNASGTIARLEAAIKRSALVYTPPLCDEPLCEVHFQQGGPDDEVPF